MSEQANVPTPWIKSLEGVRATNIDYEEISTLDVVRRRAQNEPDDPSMIFAVGKKSVSYSELWDSIERLGAYLQGMGVEKGDRVCLLLPNTPHYVISHYAVLAIGGVVVQGNPIYTVHELTEQVNDSGAKAIISITLFQDKVNEVMSKTGLEFAVLGNIGDYMKSIIAFLGKLLKKLDDPKFQDLPNNYYFMNSMKNADVTTFAPAKIDLDDVALLQYTGGTTGKAKGVMLTHRNLSINAQQARALIPKVPDKSGSVLTVLPLFHSFALTVCLSLSFQMGVPMILMPKFDAAEALKYIEKHQVTFAPGVPTMMIALLNHPDITKRDLSSLVASVSGGAALPVEVARKYIEIANVDVAEGYGLSETSPIVTGNPIQSEKLKAREGSIGLPVANTLVKIVDGEDYTKDLPQGESGEILIKGPQVMKGYWQNEEASNQALKDGWLLTGDIGYMDEDGFFYIVDRKKDLIIVSGNNVVPREVEEVLYMHDAVLEAAVAGLPHEQKGEMVAAWVVLKDGKNATEEELIQFCKDKLAPYKLPKVVQFRDDLPKSMIGKILRRKLQEEEEE